MRRGDFALLALVCFLWGVNLPLTRWLVEEIPPLFVATLRFAGTAALLSPWLLHVPRQWRRTALVGLCMGGLQFALQNAGVSSAGASASAIVAQLGLPFTLLLSVLVLGERLTWRRGAGIATALMGVLLVAYDPGHWGLSRGLWLVAASALAVAVGAVLMKGLEIGALQLQAWTCSVSMAPVGLASAWLESDQWRKLTGAGTGRWAGLLFSILFAAILGQSIYYRIVRRNPLSLVTPLMLMTPLWAVLVAVGALGERLSGRAALGAAIALGGILMMAVGQAPSPCRAARVPERVS